MDFFVFQQLGVALALGTLIGLERERRYQVDNRVSSGGIRTFALVGLMGALAYMLSAYSIAIFAVLTSGFLALLVASYVLSAKNEGRFGMTSEVAAILVYINGILSAMGMYLVATSVALAVLLILFFKDPLHKWAKHLQDQEIISTLQFIIIAFVILPLLPNKAFGPYDFFNPYIVWLMVVFISGISFLSYIAIRLLGARKGIVATGFFAGFISSTALAFSFSGDSKKNQHIINPYVLAVVVASTAMFFRVIVEVIVLNVELIKLLIIPFSAMGIVGILSSIFIWHRGRKTPEAIEKDIIKLKSPFSIMPAVKFAAFFALILFLSNFANATMGDRGLYLTSLLSGFIDVDAITVSVANLSKTDVSHTSAVFAITIAAMANTVTKGGVFLLFGNKKVALKVVLVFGLMLLSGGGSLLFI